MSKKPAPPKNIIVLYEDEQCVAFFKPAGLLTVPADTGGELSLTDIVNEQFEDQLLVFAEGAKLHPCHRLDKETSGIVLFAKGHANEQLFMDMFRRKEVRKTYIAFVHGKVANDKGEITLPLRDVGGNARGKLKEAKTRYKRISQRARFAILEVWPLTGRTNQIRIHLKEIGHPLVGESKFAHRKDFALRFKRIALHASKMVFKHPVSNRSVAIEANLSTDMKNFLEKHQK